MLTFNEERQYIDGEFEAFAEMYKEFGLSIDGEIYLTHSKQWEKIYFVLSFKPFAPKVQDDMITTDNRVVLGMFAKKYNLNPDQGCEKCTPPNSGSAMLWKLNFLRPRINASCRAMCTIMAAGCAKRLQIYAARCAACIFKLNT